MGSWLIVYFLSSLGSVSSQNANCTHLWYREKYTPGDIMVNEVMVVNTSTTTYYATLGWQSLLNGNGGYTCEINLIRWSFLRLFIHRDSGHTSWA